MKLLIPLTIIVLSFLIYYFFNAPSLGDSQNTSAIPIDTKSEVHVNPSTGHNPTPTTHVGETIPQIIDLTGGTYEDIKVKPEHEKSGSTKDYMTLDDLRAVKKNDEEIEKVKTLNFNQEVFEQVKKILQQSSSTYYAKKHIVLNTRITSVLTSNQARTKFINLMASDFGLDEEMIREQLKNHLIVWDWVSFLAP